MDVVVTVPKWFGLARWIAEGNAAGQPWSGVLWEFPCGGSRPDCQPGDRVYIIYNGKLRGYAPLVKLTWSDNDGSFIRGGEAIAVTIPEYIRGFRGWRYRWWQHEDEHPFPAWMATP